MRLGEKFGRRVARDGRGHAGLLQGRDERHQMNETSGKGKGKGSAGKGEHEGKGISRQAKVNSRVPGKLRTKMRSRRS